MQLVVFVSGAVLMSLEMLGSRILAPYFGNSIFVWGSLISVFLASLSVGYMVGGSYADRHPDRRALAAALAIPGVLTVVLPWLATPINEGLSSIDLGPRLGPLLAALALFFIPSIFLGMVSPFAIKLQVKRLETVGNTAGSLYAISTLGSIVGTLGTSFFLITWLGVRLIVHLLGVVLLILAAGVVFVSDNKTSQPAQSNTKRAKPGKGTGKHLVVLTIVAGLALSVAGGVQAAAPDVYATRKVYEKDSLYHHITVADEGGVRYLKFDASWQSGMDLRNPQKLVFSYTEFFHLGPLINASAKNALFIGLGGGSAPKNFRVNYPQLNMEVVEIDPEVIAVAKRYFSVQEDSKLKMVAKDGRIYLKRNSSIYDLVFLDAYYADSIPFHLATKEYMQELSARMSPSGVLVSNVIGAVTGTDSKIFRSMLKTYQAVFPQVYVFPVGRFEGGVPYSAMQNIILVAMKSQGVPDWAALNTRAKKLTQSMAVPSDLTRILATRYTNAVPVNDVPLLTDDYAPIDSLLPI